MNQLVEKLKKDPIFAMSLSSKELFHSNFWAWLFERNIEYARIFFPDLKDIKAEVGREEGHRDLTIWQSFNAKGKKDEAFVIENKFKSLPYKEQLIRYQNDIEEPKNNNGEIKKDSCRSFIRGVVTGIVEPDFINDDDLSKWSFMSYRSIGEGIKKVSEQVETIEYEKEMIFKYGEMVIDLYDLLIGKLSQSSSDKMIWDISDEECRNLRIQDIYQKLQAANLVKYLRGNHSLNTKIGDYELIIEQYYAQAGAGVDIRYINKLAKDEDTKKKAIKEKKLKEGDFEVIGIQIEGNQYRWCCQWFGVVPKYLEESDRLYKTIRNWGWFVDYDYKSFGKNEQKMIVDHITQELLETSMSSGSGIPQKRKEDNIPYHQIGNAKNNDYTFLHQYWSLKDITYDEIRIIIERDMKFAEQIIRKYIM